MFSALITLSLSGRYLTRLYPDRVQMTLSLTEGAKTVSPKQIARYGLSKHIGPTMTLSALE